MGGGIIHNLSLLYWLFVQMLAVYGAYLLPSPLNWQFAMMLAVDGVILHLNFLYRLCVLMLAICGANLLQSPLYWLFCEDVGG